MVKTITVSQLIRALQKQPKNAPIWVFSDSGGDSSPCPLFKVNFVKDMKRVYLEGTDEGLDEYDEDEGE